MTRLIFAGIGAAIVIGAMAVVGAVLYLLFVRRPARPAKYATGSYPAAQSPSSTGSMPPVILPMDSTDAPRSPSTPPSVKRVQYEVDDDTNRPTSGSTRAADDDFQFTEDEADSPFRPPEE